MVSTRPYPGGCARSKSTEAIGFEPFQMAHALKIHEGPSLKP
jgi:hypothetical protein